MTKSQFQRKKAVRRWLHCPVNLDPPSQRESKQVILRDDALSRRTWALLQRFISVCLLLILLPVFGFLYLLVRGTSRGGFLYAQLRPGLGGREFMAWKIRTMYEGADRNPQLARCVESSDPQVTSVGRVLRRLKIDEFPQLWNIICGHMEFVGPRPIAVRLHDELCEAIPGFESRLQVKPGLTSLGQVCIEENAGAQDVVDDWRIRFEAEKHYLDRRSVRYDLVIIVLTLLYLMRKLFRNNHATKDLQTHRAQLDLAP